MRRAYAQRLREIHQLYDEKLRKEPDAKKRAGMVVERDAALRELEAKLQRILR
jgi:hypothetical protein